MGIPKFVCSWVIKASTSSRLKELGRATRAGSRCRDLNSILGSALHLAKCQNQKLHHLSASDSWKGKMLLDCRESMRCKSNGFPLFQPHEGCWLHFHFCGHIKTPLHHKNSEKALWSYPRMRSTWFSTDSFGWGGRGWGTTPEAKCQCRQKSGPSF